MGFYPNTLYHGTSTFKQGGELFSEFEKFEGQDMSRSVSRSPVGKLGISIAEQPEVAKDFAYQASPADGEGAAMIPLRFRADKIAQIDLAGDETNDEIYGTVVDAWRQGFDALRFKNYTTPAGTKGSFFLIKNPEQIRSTNAAFDTKKKDSKNILAGALPVGTAGIVAGGAFTPEDAEAATKEPVRVNDYLKNPTLGSYESIEAVQSPMLGALADAAGEYNSFRKEKLPPGLDMILPLGELPEEYLRKKSYGDKTTLKDKVKFGLGLL